MHEFCEIGGSHSGSDEDRDLLGCDDVLLSHA
jgi:hypothetical protein